MKRPLTWFVTSFFLVFFGIFLSLWADRESVETKLLAKLIHKISPDLPFTIDAYHIEKNLEALTLDLSFDGEHAHLGGPLHWQWVKKNGIILTYSPTVSITGGPRFLLNIEAHSQREWDHLEAFTIALAKTSFVWKKWGIDAKDFSFALGFDGEKLTTALDFDNLVWTDPKRSGNEVSITHAQITAGAPHQEHAHQFQIAASADDAEILWGSAYLDLALKALPLTVNSDGQKISLNLGKALGAEIDPDVFSPGFKKAKINFILHPVSISEFLPWAGKNLASFLPSLQNLTSFNFKKGTLTADGALVYEHPKKQTRIEQLNAKFSHVTFGNETKTLAIRDLNSDIRYSESKKTNVTHLQIKEIDYEHFTAKLNPTVITWNSDLIEISGPLPLQIKNVPLTLGKVIAKLKPDFDLTTSLSLSPMNATPIASGLCLHPEKFPPLQISANYPTLEFSDSQIDPTAKTTVNLFGGSIALNDFAMFDLNTEVPETDLDLDWGAIDLKKLNDWLNFGDVQGTVEGYAHDVVLQSFLPTQYHFLIDIEPYDKVHPMARVQFSPEAMKNTVKLFTGADLDETIPGIASWFMFGWPSHVLGGYDVYYAGLKLTSEDGRIIIETLDKPGIFEQERKHFVLYGNRFKMPLQSKTYPLIVDAPAMNNFVHQLLGHFQAIKQKKENNLNESDSDTCIPHPL
jgi:hypothetical protein